MSLLNICNTVGIIRAFCLPEGGGGGLLIFSMPGGIEKIAGLWFARGDQYSG